MDGAITKEMSKCEKASNDLTGVSALAFLELVWNDLSLSCFIMYNVFFNLFHFFNTSDLSVDMREFAVKLIHFPENK